MKLINNLMNAVRHYTAMDFAVFKICLVAIGILLGTYFAAFFTNYIVVVWIIAAVAWLTLIIQTARYYGKK
jgi:small multidrug resistance family-3 protein